MRLPTDVTFGAGQAYIDTLGIHFHVLGMNRTQQFAFGDAAPLWVGLSGRDEQGKFCNVTVPSAD